MREWISVESDNYIINYHKGAYAEKNIDKIIKNQEYCFRLITRLLEVDFDMKIEYFLCDTPEEVGELYGDNDPCNGFARKPNKVYAVYNEKVQCIGYHEDAHIISYKIATPPSVFFREGLAMYFDKKHLGISTLDWTIYALKTDKFVEVSKLINDEEFYNNSWIITYPMAGCFTDFLIGYFGKDLYLKFYKTCGNDIELSFSEAFGIRIHEVSREFKNYVNSFKLEEGIFNLIDEEYKK